MSKAELLSVGRVVTVCLGVLAAGCGEGAAVVTPSEDAGCVGPGRLTVRNRSGGRVGVTVLDGAGQEVLSAVLGPRESRTVDAAVGRAAVQLRDPATQAVLNELAADVSCGAEAVAEVDGVEFRATIRMFGTGVDFDQVRIELRSPSDLSLVCSPGVSCEVRARAGTELVFGASAGPNDTFVAWTGACSGGGECRVTITDDVDVYAEFAPAAPPPPPMFGVVRVAVSGTGFGLVSSQPAGIDCDTQGGATACEAQFPRGSQLVVTAQPNVVFGASMFTAWRAGPCSGSADPVCSFEVNAAQFALDAEFSPARHELAVAIRGSRPGRVYSSPAGIDCGPTCTASFENRVPVTLTATTSDVNAGFVAWGGACGDVVPSCVLNLQAPALVEAYFAPLEGRLELATSGDGLGQITAVSPPLRCGSGATVCTGTVARGTNVTLEAVPAMGSLLGTWTGACAAAGSASTCVVTVSALTTVGFEFRLPPCPGAMGARCGGLCRDLLEDEDHCGACGRACAGSCSGGVCTAIGLDWLDSAPTGLRFLRTEVTHEQFAACVRAGPCAGTLDGGGTCNYGSGRPPTLPMNCVDWTGADRFCTWSGGRLPTEDEWYAEASNNGTRDYPWGADPASCARAVMGPNGCSTGRTEPVCSRLSGNSVSGLCDMSGNVWEWTSTQTQGGTRRVIRGGSWYSTDQSNLRASARFGSTPVRRDDGVGFRCVRPARQ